MDDAATEPAVKEQAARPAPLASIMEAMQYDYFKQILPAPPVCCGLQLKPLSVGRYRLMARHKVAFVAEAEASAGVRDLLWAALICSRRCDEFNAFIAQKDALKQMRKWGRRFGFFEPRSQSWPIIGKWLTRKVGAAIAASDAVYLREQMDIFQTYIADASESPPYFDEGRGNRASGAHWSQSIEAVLREFQGWTKEEVEEEPLSKALADYFKHMENHAMVRLLTPAELASQKKQMVEQNAPEKVKEWQDYLAAVAAAKAGAQHG